MLTGQAIPPPPPAGDRRRGDQAGPLRASGRALAPSQGGRGQRGAGPPLPRHCRPWGGARHRVGPLMLRRQAAGLGRPQRGADRCARLSESVFFALRSPRTLGPQSARRPRLRCVCGPQPAEAGRRQGHSLRPQRRSAKRPSPLRGRAKEGAACHWRALVGLCCPVRHCRGRAGRG